MTWTLSGAARNWCFWVQFDVSKCIFGDEEELVNEVTGMERESGQKDPGDHWNLSKNEWCVDESDADQE